MVNLFIPIRLMFYIGAATTLLCCRNHLAFADNVPQTTDVREDEYVCVKNSTTIREEDGIIRFVPQVNQTRQFIALTPCSSHLQFNISVENYDPNVMEGNLGNVTTNGIEVPSCKEFIRKYLSTNNCFFTDEDVACSNVPKADDNYEEEGLKYKNLRCSSHFTMSCEIKNLTKLEGTSLNLFNGNFSTGGLYKHFPCQFEIITFQGFRVLIEKSKKDEYGIDGENSFKDCKDSSECPLPPPSPSSTSDGPPQTTTDASAITTTAAATSAPLTRCISSWPFILIFLVIAILLLVLVLLIMLALLNTRKQPEEDNKQQQNQSLFAAQKVKETNHKREMAKIKKAEPVSPPKDEEASPPKEDTVEDFFDDPTDKTEERTIHKAVEVPATVEAPFFDDSPSSDNMQPNNRFSAEAGAPPPSEYESKQDTGKMNDDYFG